MKTLIIVDMQNDFMPSGTLAVPNADAIVPIINALQKKFDCIIATQDWHPSNHQSFASNHPGKKPFDVIQLNGIEQILWPDHCVQGTPGADFYPGLEIKNFKAVFQKGMDVQIDSYSGFYDNDHKHSTGLADYLRKIGAQELYFCGACTDFCVLYSILDAVREGFDCYLILDATAPFDQNNLAAVQEKLLAHKVKILQSHEL